MRIVIGDTPRIGPSGQYSPDMGSGLVEAKLLDIRGPRRERERPPDGTERRESSENADPASGRILVLLIPEGYRIPRGIESGSHRIYLRFVQRSPGK